METTEISVVISATNAAFFSPQGAPAIAAEITRILQDLALRVDCGALQHPGDNVQLYDCNGNSVGYATAK